MNSFSKDLALPVLKNCFPGADNIRIVHDQVEEGQRHISSDVIRFVVEYEQDRVTQRKHVVFKVPCSGLLSSMCENLKIYEREIIMYEKVIPQINKYLDKSLAPAHFHTTDSKILVLEDLTARGYVSGEKLKLLNFDEAKGTMKTFANLHSATHKLYRENPKIFHGFVNSLFAEVDIMKMVTPWRPVVLELLRRKKEYRLISKVESAFWYLEDNKNKILTILSESNFNFVALNHGDSRKDNFLFKHAENNEVKVQFVDYQICFVSSPAYDICNFLQGSVRADVLEAHFDDLIDGYLRELNMKLKKLDCASTYERDNFDEDFRKMKFFYFFSFMCLCCTVCPLDREQIANVLDPSATSTDDTHLCDPFLDDEKFVQPVYDWLKYFEKSKMFHEF